MIYLSSLPLGEIRCA